MVASIYVHGFLLVSSALILWAMLPDWNRERMSSVFKFAHLRKNLTPWYPFGGVKRADVDPDKADWGAIEDDWWYNPSGYTSPRVLQKPEWADEMIKPGTNQVFKWNEVDGSVNRKSFTGIYRVRAAYWPLNPAGRTGISERGVLGRWGPNHAADTIVTRVKTNEDGKVVVAEDGKSVGQFIAIQRKDTGDWAIPGGMIEPGEDALSAAKREFYEEVFNIEKANDEEKAELDAGFAKLFATVPAKVYEGYVDDPRNTDNAWMETQAVNFHAEEPDVLKFLSGIKFKAGSDAKQAAWVDISSSLALYASHRDFIEKVAKDRNWAW